MNRERHHFSAPDQRQGSRWRRLLMGWAILLGMVSIVFAVYLNIHFYIGFPIDDQWSSIDELVNNHGHYSLAQLWEQHNEHRIPIGRLLMQADLYWFRGKNISLFLEIYLLQIVHLVLFAAAFRRLSGWPKWISTVGIGLAAFAIFWGAQYESFINPFEFPFLQAFVGPTLAVVSLLFVLKSPTAMTPWLAGVAGGALLAESGLANGLFVWPVVFILALRFQLRPKVLYGLGAAGVICVAFYIHGYRNPPGLGSPLESLHQPDRVIQYMLIYFGSLWPEFPALAGKVLAGIGLITVPVIYAIELVRPKVKPFALTFISLAMYFLGTGFLTALGRIVLPLEQAASSRYQTGALLFWLCTVIYLIDYNLRKETRSGLAVCIATLVIFTAILPSYSGAFAKADDYWSGKQRGVLPLLTEVRDDVALTYLFPGTDLLFADKKMLRDRRASFYADRDYLDLGQPLSNQFSIQAANRCFGAFDASRRISDVTYPGWELTGWGWDHKAMRPVERLVAVTDGRTISGLGATGLPRPDVRKAVAEVRNAEIGWRVYLKGADQFASVQVYGVVDGGRSVCLIVPAFALAKR